MTATPSENLKSGGVDAHSDAVGQLLQKVSAWAPAVQTSALAGITTQVELFVVGVVSIVYWTFASVCSILYVNFAAYWTLVRFKMSKPYLSSQVCVPPRATSLPLCGQPSNSIA